MSRNMRFNGAFGEVYAARFLREKQYTLRYGNYRTRMGEIDIIAQDGETLVFVEVKTRSAGSIALPGESVGREKQRRLTMAASQYIRNRGNVSHMPSRFDVVEVYLDAYGALQDIRHIENAFESCL